MQNETELITECRNKVLSNQKLTEEMTTQLFNVDDKILGDTK